MRHKILLLLLAILSVAVDATELPTDPAQWQPSTHYELTTAMTLDSAATFPRNSTLTITDTGHLKLTNGSTTLDCATGSAIIIDGGELELAGIGSTVYCEKGNSIVLSAGEIKLAQRNTHLICDTASRISLTGGRISLGGVRSSLDLYDGSTVDLSGGEIRLSGNSSSLLLSNNSRLIVSNGQISLVASNSSLTCNNGCAIIMSGGYIDGISQLIGRHGAFSAPIMRVIDPDVALQGDWRMDRAYPQWFAADDCDDWSVPINKAINMKGTGEVFLPRGNYPVKATIYVNFGIQLIGDGGRVPEGSEGTPVGATIISPTNDSCFDQDYIVKVNVKSANNGTYTWATNHPIPGTELRNLYFYDRTVSRHLGVLAAGGFTADCVTWNGTKQAVAFLAGLYSDQRRITNCTYYPHGSVDNDTIYAFDLNCLGDAVVFEGNHVSNYRSDRPALRVSETGGATIVSNILNSDVLITSSKAVYFGANHCETGAQVRCVCSTVKLENNFYEKGDRPSVVIEGNVHYNSSVVSMDGEMFGYYDGYRGEESREQAIARLEAISEYDIGIDRYSQLSLNNTYRYDILCNNGAGTQYTYGVNVAQIAKDTIQGETLSLLADFFKYSHVLSASSRIQPGFQVVRSLPLSHPDSAYIVEYGPAGLSSWFGQMLADADTINHNYQYKYDIYNDSTIVTQGTLSRLRGNSQWLIRMGKSTSPQANLIYVAQGSNSGYQLMVKFRREHFYSGIRIDADTKVVTVPLSGARNIFDNGISICGYQWKTEAVP